MEEDIELRQVHPGLVRKKAGEMRKIDSGLISINGFTSDRIDLNVAKGSGFVKYVHFSWIRSTDQPFMSSENMIDC